MNVARLEIIVRTLFGFFLVFISSIPLFNTNLKLTYVEFETCKLSIFIYNGLLYSMLDLID